MTDLEIQIKRCERYAIHAKEVGYIKHPLCYVCGLDRDYRIQPSQLHYYCQNYDPLKGLCYHKEVNKKCHKRI